MGDAVRRLWAAWWLAVTFLTTLPAPTAPGPEVGLGAAGRWFPAVGLLIGGILWAGYALVTPLLPAAVAGVLITALWAALTGGLHLDGLADCCDGLLPPVDRDRRLEIMRDPRVGSFGSIGLVLVLLLKSSAVAAAPPLALLLAPVWARGLLLWAARQPQARSGGMGAHFAAGLTPSILLGAAALPLALLVVARPFYPALAAAMAAVLVCLGCISLARRRLGGVTGDLYGLVVEASETAVLVVMAAQG